MKSFGRPDYLSWLACLIMYALVSLKCLDWPDCLGVHALVCMKSLSRPEEPWSVHNYLVMLELKKSLVDLWSHPNDRRVCNKTD